VSEYPDSVEPRFAGRLEVVGHLVGLCCEAYQGQGHVCCCQLGRKGHICVGIETCARKGVERFRWRSSD